MTTPTKTPATKKPAAKRVATKTAPAIKGYNDPTLASIEAWFKQAVPKPSDRTRAAQLGCFFEEVHELMLSGGGISSAGRETTEAVADALKLTGSISPTIFDRVALADALADVIVTAMGFGYMMNIDVAGALQEVNKANWSKFIEGSPLLDANGKIMKASGYVPPQLEKFVKDIA
jgi:predicted HAD superfamily Cof-like phosphohydrolase